MASSKPSSNQDHKKYVPGEETPGKEIFDFNFLVNDKSTAFICSHKRIMFIIRGPPGTAKNTLSSLIKDRYPSSVICSADNYFDEMFVSKLRTKDTMKQSHYFCQKRVTEECEKNTHPIIIQNSHVQKCEVQPYLDFAAQYGYTIFMAITPRKFKIDAECLERSNRKGLTKKYFKNRLRQWQELVPSFLGWFLNPEDSSYLLNQGKKSLTALLANDEFSKVFNARSEENILDFYEVKDRLFCILAFCGCSEGGKECYLSDVVQNAYGMVFDLLVQGFIISKTFILAVIDLPPEAKDLLSIKPVVSAPSSDIDNIAASALEKLNVQDLLEPASGSSSNTFRKVPESKGQTVAEIKWEKDEEMKVNNLSVVVLGESKGKSKPITDVPHFLNETFSDVMNAEGKVPVAELLKFDNGTKYFKLPRNTWFVQLPKKAQITAILTGLYT